MTEKKDYYAILEIARDATPQEIKSAYRTLAKKYHPDICRDKAGEDKFKEISEAYEVLIDSDRRREYDGVGGQEAAAEPFGPKGFRWTKFTHYSDIDDIYQKNTFESFVKKEKAATRGTDIRVDAEITLEESAFGVEKTVDVPYTEPCPHCRGTGSMDLKFSICSYCKGEGQLKNVSSYGRSQVIDLVVCINCGGSGRLIARRCRSCGGKGTVQNKRSVVVTVPAGAQEGGKIFIGGMGEKGSNGGSDGDLYVVIRLKPHEFFRVSGRDIHSELPISFTDAALGSELRIRTLWGESPLTIPPGTQPGEIFTLREMGLPKEVYGFKGDHIVRVVIIEVPKNLTARQKHLLEEFARESGDAEAKRIKKSGFFGT